MSTERSRRPTLGVLVDWLEDDYQNAVLSGVLAATRVAHLSTICFTGGVLGSPARFGARRNGVYELANTSTVDGLVILSGTLGNHVGPDELVRYCARYRGLPMASIGVPLPDIPSFLVDNARGTEMAIRHLIEVHGYRRIAFVRGPAVNEEAERRFEVYRNVLVACGLPYDPDLVTPGNFQAQAGVDAVGILLDERGRRFDALVAANDHMALGALGALLARKLRVPADVAIVGFDDIEEARFAPVPLATVRQPLWEQGRLAAESVIERITGVTAGEGVVLDAEFVPRRSCGCWGAAAEGARGERRTARPSWATGDPAALDPQERARLACEMTEAVRGSTGSLDGTWAEPLLDLFLAESVDPQRRAFTTALERRLERVGHDGADVHAWQGVVTILGVAAGRALTGEAAECGERLLHGARILVSAIAERVQAARRIQAELWLRTLRRSGEILITTFDAKSLARAVAEQMPFLGIPSCYLSVFEESPSLGTGLSWRPARLLLAYDESSGRAPLIDGEPYPAHQLIPAELLPEGRVYTLVVEPLFFDEQQLGFVALEMGPRSGVVYEALRSQLATALKGGLLVTQVLEEAKRRQLEERSLRQAQKMEAVGTLAAGIAHEINTPMQYASDTVLFLKDAFSTLQELYREYRERALSLARSGGQNEAIAAWEQADERADSQYLLEQAPLAFERALEGLGRVGTIVHALKDFAHPGQRQMGAADVNRAITSTLAVARSEYKYVAEVVTDLGELPSVVCHVGDLNQVFLNLIVNAAHAIGDVVRGTEALGQIRITTLCADGDVIIRIGDTGGGIPESVADRVFDPFFTTKEVGKGTGQGLAIARSIVVDRHHGTLSFESRVGVGTTFTIRLPVSQPT